MCSAFGTRTINRKIIIGVSTFKMALSPKKIAILRDIELQPDLKNKSAHAILGYQNRVVVGGNDENEQARRQKQSKV